MRVDPAREPWGTRWPLRYPRAYLALAVVGFLWLGVLAVSGAVYLARGHHGGAVVLAEAFRLGLLAMAVVGLRAAIRTVRDPQAERERRRRVRERALAQPLAVLRRKAAGVLALIVLVVVGSGAAVLVVGRAADRPIGWFLVALGVGTAAYGAWRLRRLAR